MTSRLLLSGTILEVAVRRKRKSDGALFAIAKIRDTDRNESRIWTVFVNDLDLIERAEELRSGDPIAVAGPFSIAIGGSSNEPTLDHRITAEAFVDTRRRRKSKTQKRIEERVVTDNPEMPAADGGDPDDDLPF